MQNTQQAARSPMYHALVVEDNQGVAELVQEKLESLGHTCDSAETQDEARRLLAQRSYAYVLLDLEIPVRYGRLARIDNGKNLLREIRRTKGYEDVPIVVMTAYGKNSYRLSREVLRLGGANDFVAKPFLDGKQTLERAITDVLRSSGRSRPGARSRSNIVCDPVPPQPLEEGEMVFSETRVELCGVKICDGVGSGLMRAILDVLREKDSRGRFIALSGEELASQAGNVMTRQNDIADAVRRLREKIQKALLELANVRCNRGDVITNDRRYGYRLSRKITVRDAGDAENAVRDQPEAPKNAADAAMELSVRQKWIVEELASKGAMLKEEILRGFSKQFRLSKTTLERELKVLRNRNLIRFEGEKRTGRWCCE